MTEYSPGVIKKFADRLYARASFTEFAYTSLGLVLGGIGGYVVGPATELASPALSAVVGALVLGSLGIITGNEKAFTLRLDAQRALCLVAIEKNTRKEESLQSWTTA